MWELGNDVGVIASILVDKQVRLQLCNYTKHKYLYFIDDSITISEHEWKHMCKRFDTRTNETFNTMFKVDSLLVVGNQNETITFDKQNVRIILNDNQFDMLMKSAHAITEYCSELKKREETYN